MGHPHFELFAHDVVNPYMMEVDEVGWGKKNPSSFGRVYVFNMVFPGDLSLGVSSITSPLPV
jgi:hypothetical protein